MELAATSSWGSGGGPSPASCGLLAMSSSPLAREDAQLRAKLTAAFRSMANPFGGNLGLLQVRGCLLRGWGPRAGHPRRSAGAFVARLAAMAVGRARRASQRRGLAASASR